MSPQEVLSLELLQHLNPFSSALVFYAVSSLIYYLYITRSRKYALLRSIPGPALASITKLWVSNKTRGNQRQVVDLDLHRKYGSVVRVAPQEVIFSSPTASRRFMIDDHVWHDPNTFDMLIETNMEKYRLQRRLIGPALTADFMKNVESNIDDILVKNLGIMHDRAGQEVDADLFFNRFVSDCVSMSAFSVHHGLVEAGQDDGLIQAVHNAWNYMHVSGYFPLAHRFFVLAAYYGQKLRSLRSLLPKHVIRIFSKFRVLSEEHSPFQFPRTNIQKRFALNSTAPISAQGQPTDIIGKLFQIQGQKSALLNGWISSTCATLFGAGVETTGIILHSFLNYVLSDPGCQAKIQYEIDTARKEGKLSNPPKLREMKDHLPYTIACLNEIMRLHPVVGMPLPRTVPEGGSTIDGYQIPAGTTVGVNTWVLNRDKGLYGEDADQWRPERWLEYAPEYLKHLESYNLTFGAGTRSCPGKHVAQAIYWKIIPSIFSDFEWEFAEPEAKKVLRTTFGVRYMKLMMKWKNRTPLV